VTLYSSKLESKKIVVETNFEFRPVLLLARGELHQVISNIVSNAIDASLNGGRIEIAITAGEKDSTAITIKDSGAGIADEVQSRLFEPFFTTKRDVGTGLGLWVSRQLMERMGGTISYRTASSGASTGTSFTLNFGPTGIATTAS
jgi:signal transduction histidine kinase